MAKYQGDDDIQLLHALRVGLCLKIGQGSITFERATKLFNRAHETVIQEKQLEESEAGKEVPKL
ncbi:MAG: hypothetical protein K9N21_20340 [Deltaproteobacteria bacterium]|nr:hypothetical protein [Deltaproteobacteria bacterium]